MKPFESPLENPFGFTRRHFFARTARGFGARRGQRTGEHRGTHQRRESQRAAEPRRRGDPM